MEFSVSREQAALRDELIGFSRNVLNTDAAERDRTATFDRSLWRRCGELRLPGMAIPAVHGGRGLDSLSCAIAIEALGYACLDGGLVFSLGAHALAAAVPLWKHGAPEQHAAYLPKFCDGTWVAAIAMTEPEAGSDVFSIATRAEKDGDGYRLTGHKTLITNAAVADVGIVFAVTDPQKGFHGGLTAFLVDLSSPGVTRREPMDLMSVRTASVGDLLFADVRVPASAILGGVGGGSGVFTTAMDWERSCLFASHVGNTERLLERAIKQAKTRAQSGQSIGKFQAVSHRLADMKMRLEASRLLVYRAAWRIEHARTMSLDASLAKISASETYLDAALNATKIHGGGGLITDCDVQRSLRDAVAGTIYSGTNDIQRNIVARWLGV